jgi:hypothetical protein
MDHMVGVLVANLLDRENLDLCGILVPTPMIRGNDANNRDRYPPERLVYSCNVPFVNSTVLTDRSTHRWSTL